MKRLLTYLCALFFTVSSFAQGGEALSATLGEYLASLERETLEVKEKECDFLISTCKDSLIRQEVALRIYDHYFGSKVMGDESVAIYIYDKWFAPGKVSFKTPLDGMNAKIFADFNRSSLIGKQAPEIVLRDLNDEKINPLKASEGRWKVFFFYDTSCATCKIESVLLKNLVQENKYPVDFYAIYTGDNEASWARYRATSLPSEGMIHLWDPSMESDFLRKYGILQTPGMFLIGPSGIIEGRKLDTAALQTLLDREFAPKEYEYASDESKALFDELFDGGVSSPEEVVSVADYFASETLEKGDSLLFRHVSGDLLYYLSSQKGHASRKGTKLFIEKYILPFETDPEIRSLAGLMYQLLSKCPEGEVVPSLSLHGELHRKPCLFRKGTKAGSFKLDKLGGKKSFIVFYTSGCGSCEEILSSVGGVVSQRGVNVLLVDMDELFSSYPQEAKAALDAFDLSSLPFIISLDGKGAVTDKYLDSLE